MTPRRIVIVLALLAASVVVSSCAMVVWPLFKFGPASIHMRSVKNELADWEQEHRTIRDWRQAWQAAGMLEYVRVYYVPGEGYRSTPEYETELAAQRDRTLSAIVTGLREYTGQDFGTDAAEWKEWLTAQGHADGR